MLHADLTGGKRKRPSIVTRCFQGELEVTTLAGTGALPALCADTAVLMLGPSWLSTGVRRA